MPAEPGTSLRIFVRSSSSCRKLRIFLDELVNGAPPIPLKLYPEYEAMQLARGLKAAAPTDLFYPDLSPRAPRIAPRESIASSSKVTTRQKSPTRNVARVIAFVAGRYPKRRRNRMTLRFERSSLSPTITLNMTTVNTASQSGTRSPRILSNHSAQTFSG